MFEALSDKLNGVFGRLGNKGRLTERDVDEALREVRMALLEADVNFRVAREFIARIREEALKSDVLKSLSPGQQVVKITNDALVDILGGKVHRLESGPRRPSVILMVGLNGAGKTTASAKLARHLKQDGQLPVMVAADLQRPAAIQQLETLGGQIDVSVYQDAKSGNTPKVAKDGVKRAAELNAAWAIVDTAGRFQVDDELMSELESVKDAVSPDETLLVVDAMTGQEAVEAAKQFHDRIGLTGLIMTKMDGDARGGAALSITSVTGVPIKFMGTGERADALEAFYPDRLASRILGMGDMLTLIDKAQASFDEDEAAEMERKIRQATFDLDDFLGQLQQLKQMGPISQVLEMVPGFSAMKGKVSVDELDGSHLVKTEAIIRSMTPEERRRPEIIGGSRRRRIARGSGTTPQDVNQLLNQFSQMQKMMRQFMGVSSGKGSKRQSKKMRRMMRQQGNILNMPNMR
ncbi:MAG: signal recognition particle protein [Chloroflexota bacterium]|nr:signal recognition particle protein [Chloroflexota bacterium]MDE2687651.1 signal recognition particle protein [Chloroflexota bacterium]